MSEPSLTTSHATERQAPSIPQQQVSFAEAFRFWFKLGWISFGGPAGQIALERLEQKLKGKG